MSEKNEIGQVIGASLSEGILVQLNKSSYVEEISSNSLVTINGDKRKYLGLIANISLIKGSQHASKLANIESRFLNERVKDITKSTKELFNNYGVFFFSNTRNSSFSNNKIFNRRCGYNTFLFIQSFSFH